MAHEKMGEIFNDAKFVKMYKTAEQFTGHFAGELINRSSFKDDLARLDKVAVLDNACGTGIVSSKVMAMVDEKIASKVELVCADNADAMVNMITSRIENSGWQNATAVKADAQVWSLLETANSLWTDTLARTPNFRHLNSLTSSSALDRCSFQIQVQVSKNAAACLLQVDSLV